jgi:PX domain
MESEKVTKEEEDMIIEPGDDHQQKRRPTKVIEESKKDETEEEKKGQDEGKAGTDKGETEKETSQKSKNDDVLQVLKFEDDLNMEFVVNNPDDRNGHIEYYVKGKDRLGEWNGQRRYTHFYLLHEVLTQRWPGLYLPLLPPKKAIGRYEEKFIAQRRYGLERYLRKLGNYEFIVNSEEFIIFSRPNGDIEKTLSRLTKLPNS